MKFLLALVLSIAATVAVAGTVNLGSETCSNNQVCLNVPNDSGLTIDWISDANQYQRLLVSINGDVYDSGLWGAPNLSAFTLYDGAGHVLTGSLSITITHAAKCVQEGRVCVFPKTVTLNGGSLYLP